MKKVYSIILFIAIAINTNAQAPLIKWEKSFGGSSDETAFVVRQTYDAGYIVLGQANSTDGDLAGELGGYWLIKLDSTGAIQWQQCYDGGGSYLNSLDITSDHGYVIAGGVGRPQISGILDFNFGIIKIDSIGTIQWTKSLGGSDIDFANSIKQTKDGGYIAAGISKSNNGDVSGHHGDTLTYDYWIVKLDSSANIQWQKSYGGVSSYCGSDSDDGAYVVRQTKDGGYIAAGYTYSNNDDVSGNHGGSDYWIIKLDTVGSLLWQKCLGGSGNDYAYSLEPTLEGGFIVAGSTNSYNGDITSYQGNQDAWVVKLDSIGNIQWQNSMGGSSDDCAKSVKQTSDGGFIVTGGTLSNDGEVLGNHGNYDCWVIKLDSSGIIQWQKTLGGTQQDFANSVEQTNDRSYILTGGSLSNDGDVTGHHGTYWYADCWVVKLDTVFATAITEINNQQSSIHISPNPTTSVFSISSLEEKIIEIEIHNIVGELIYKTSTTTPQTTIDLSKQPKGIYFVQVTDTNKNVTNKKIIMQ